MDNRTRENKDIRDRNVNDQHLYRLGELDDYKVASDDPDVRGWTIVDRDNREFGKINELIVDPEQEKVRYLDVTQKGYRGTAGEEHLLIPIGVARIDETDDRVIVRDIDTDLLNSYPSHKGDVITRDYEYEVIERFNRPETTTRDRREGADFYNNEFYDETRFYTNRDRSRNTL